MDRITGTVKWFSTPKGYGFVTLPDGRDVFVHYTAIEGDGYRELSEGERIELSIVESDIGLKAQSVTRVSAQTH
jgi:cold shock protein